MTIAPKIQKNSTGIAGPGGGYFHKHYAGSTAPVVTPSLEADAIVTLAGFAVDRDDFDHLVDLLGLKKALIRMQDERRAS